ncbi:MAG: hypothetical protein J6C52_11965, partial [Clostridia bacterium]|nr:hypothetical protein [Clostridia bacterium]
MAKRKRSLTLAILITLGMLFSCGDTAPSADTTGSADTTTAPDTTPIDPLPEADFGGRDVNFYLDQYFCPLEQTEETGDLVNDAIYRRTRKVEDRYNVNFRYAGSLGNSSDWKAWYGALEASIMADDDSIDIASGYYYRLAGTTVTSD